MARLDGGGWQRIVAEAGVFARVSPQHKLRIVEALQARGEVVAVAAVVTCVALQLAAVYWRPLQVVLHTVPLRGVDWALVLGWPRWRRWNSSS
ncbi:cation transporting ATPase C-terminal domain-containing protein [Nannocystis pusilla]|uniref:Cation-transporting P-type ATPase C-terminal domain-containing protein n=1 Tax=Nannocystis pusilla TaxID=889268 RepID=A0ABS7TM96_9BACT|nr:cation transporting ATPase C-terminal domain-containing protein [Nannocystis pusilla]MBZ5709348.1 hypothetical protein [Nannocystis pusilla]